MAKTETQPSTSWEVSTKRYVGFVDIMGFKDMVMRLPHESVYEIMKKTSESTIDNQKIKWPSGENLIRSFSFSDSIMFFSKDDSIECFQSIVSYTASLAQDFFENGIPHKGALAHGLFTTDCKNAIYFGQPLIDAYFLQEEINFYGILLHASAEKRFKQKTTDKHFPFIHEYNCPFKNGWSKHFTITPMHADSKDDKTYNKDYLKLTNGISELRYHTSGAIRKYIDNTEMYLKSINEQ